VVVIYCYRVGDVVYVGGVGMCGVVVAITGVVDIDVDDICVAAGVRCAVDDFDFV